MGYVVVGLVKGSIACHRCLLLFVCQNAMHMMPSCLEITPFTANKLLRIAGMDPLSAAVCMGNVLHWQFDRSSCQTEIEMWHYHLNHLCFNAIALDVNGGYFTVTLMRR